MANEFDLRNFLGITPPDPNDPFALPAPSTSEIIARLAANLTPLAPFIGGTRTTLGRALGAGAVLGGGAGQTVADILAQQRLDPGARLQRMAALAQQLGTAPTPSLPAATTGLGLASEEAAGVQGLSGLEAPPIVNSGVMLTPGGYSSANIPAGPRMIFEKLGLVPSEKDIAQTEYLKRGANLPLSVGENTRLVDPITKQVILEAQPSPAERDKQRNDQLYRSFIGDVETTMKEKGLGRQEAANVVLDRPGTDYAQIPIGQNYPLIAEAKEARVLANQENAADRRARDAQDREDRRNRERMAAEDRAAMRADRRFQQQLDTTVLPGVFANKETGEVGQISRGDHAKNPANYKRVSQTEAATVDFLSTALPMIDRMEELVPKVLAKHKGKQLGTVMANYAAHRMGFDPDLQDLMQLGTALSVEQARALSGSSRVLGSMFEAVRGEVVPGIGVTAETAMRQLSTGRQEIQNRINSIVGRPLQKIVPNTPSGPNIAKPPPTQAEIDAAKRLGIPLQ